MRRVVLAGLCLFVAGCAGTAPNVSTPHDAVRPHLGGGRFSDQRAEARIPVEVEGHYRSVWECIVGRSADAVVHVRTLEPAHDPSLAIDTSTVPASVPSGGTGVVIRSDGIVLTAEHVIRHALDIKIVFQDGSWAPVERVVIAPRCDLAVLRIDAGVLDSVALSDTPFERGHRVMAIGCTGPGSAAQSRTGMITNTRVSVQDELDPLHDRDYSNLLETTAPPDPGFSGGPLLDAHGRLVGLNVAMSETGAVRRGYAIPFDARMRMLIERLIAQVER